MDIHAVDPLFNHTNYQSQMLLLQYLKNHFKFVNLEIVTVKIVPLETMHLNKWVQTKISPPPNSPPQVSC